MSRELGLNERGYSGGSRVGERLIIASRISTNSARSAPAANSHCIFVFINPTAIPNTETCPSVNRIGS